jgi:hypothetical protein
MPFKRWFVGFSHWEFPMGFSHGTNTQLESMESKYILTEYCIILLLIAIAGKLVLSPKVLQSALQSSGVTSGKAGKAKPS